MSLKNACADRPTLLLYRSIDMMSVDAMAPLMFRYLHAVSHGVLDLNQRPTNAEGQPVGLPLRQWTGLPVGVSLRAVGRRLI